MSITTHIFIQARMSSARFPGKMLIDVKGVPLLQRVVDQAQSVSNANKVVVLTSTESNDNALEEYCDHNDIACFRGDLNNVFVRFQAALEIHPCDYMVRVCGDSPLISPALIEHCITTMRDNGADFFSNVQGKSFPKGQSIEIVKASFFNGVDAQSLSPDEQEHVMPYFHARLEDYSCCFLDQKPSERHLNHCIDTLEDLERIESNFVPYNFDKNNLICTTTNP